MDSSDHSQTLPKYRGRHPYQKNEINMAIFMVILPKLLFEISEITIISKITKISSVVET